MAERGSLVVAKMPLWRLSFRAVEGIREQAGLPEFQMLVRVADVVGAVMSLEPPDREVRFGHFLEMVDEQRVDRRAAGRADDRQRLRDQLFGHAQREARSDP